MKKLFFTIISLMMIAFQVDAQSYKFVLNAKVSDQNGKLVANYPVVIEREKLVYKILTDGNGIATDVNEFKDGYNPVFKVSVEGACNSTPGVPPAVIVTAYDGTEDINFTICTKVDTIPCKVSFNYTGTNIGDGTYIFTAQPNIPGAIYKWEFGDGTSAEGAIVKHTFPAAGVYGVTLSMLTKGCIAFYDQKVEVKGTNPPPPPPPSMTCECCATMNISPQNDKHLFLFNGNANFKAADYNWNINGIEISGQEAKYKFEKSGKYLVTMEAKGENCYVKINKTLIIEDDSTNTGNNDCKIDFVYTGSSASNNILLFKPVVNANANVKLLWSFGDGETSTEFSPQHEYAKSGTYKVTLQVTFENGKVCTITKVVVVNIKITTGPGKGIKVGEVSPNPTTATFVKLEISSELTQKIEIKILDAAGNIVKTVVTELNPGSNVVVIDLSNLKPGVYYLIVSQGGKTINTQKLIITG